MADKISTVILGGWIVGSILLMFVFGGGVLFTPYLPFVRDWLEQRTLYDLVVSMSAFIYAVSMSLVAVTTGISANPSAWNPRDRIILLVLGLLILVFLVVGRFLA